MAFVKISEQPSLYDDLEKKSVHELLVDINTEDKKVALAVEKALPQMEDLVTRIVPRMKKGGRVFYMGAGTSGRLGVLDASELPPTFGVPSTYVYGLIAGGDYALRNAVENAEDDTKRGWAYCKMNPKQAYIVAMGVNDYTRRKRNNLKCGSLDTDVDLKDYNNNAPTYAGYMAGIIQRLQSIQPKAKIFVVTRPQTDKGNNAYDEFNEVVRGLARMFSNVYVIDLFKHAPLYDADFQDRYYVGGHLNAMGYEYTARVFMTYIDWIIRNNYKEFKEVAFIGTKLHYTPDNELKKKK